MRKSLGFLFISAILLSVVACSNDEIKEEDVMSFVQEYKTEQYTIKDPTKAPTGIEIGQKVKKYLSEDVFEQQMANRNFELAPNVAKEQDKSIELQEVLLEKEKENDDGTIDYYYTLKLKFYDGQSSEIVIKKGELTISNEDGLKITRDWDRKIKIGNGDI